MFEKLKKKIVVALGGHMFEAPPYCGKFKTEAESAPIVQVKAGMYFRTEETHRDRCLEIAMLDAVGKISEELVNNGYVKFYKVKPEDGSPYVMKLVAVLHVVDKEDPTYQQCEGQISMEELL